MVSSARSAEERRRRGGGLKEMIRSESSIVFGCDSNQLICRLVLRGGGGCEKLFSKPMWEILIYKIFFPLSHFKEMKAALIL